MASSEIKTRPPDVSAAEFIATGCRYAADELDRART